MSLVGTRPILQDELRQYELHHRARIAIKPGIEFMEIAYALTRQMQCIWYVICIMQCLF